MPKRSPDQQAAAADRFAATDQGRAQPTFPGCGAPFVAVAREIYRTNDRRPAIKRQLNDLAGARFVGEKHYRVSQ